MEQCNSERELNKFIAKVFQEGWRLDSVNREDLIVEYNDNKTEEDGE